MTPIAVEAASERDALAARILAIYEHEDDEETRETVAEQVAACTDLEALKSLAIFWGPGRPYRIGLTVRYLTKPNFRDPISGGFPYTGGMATVMMDCPACASRKGDCWCEKCRMTGEVPFDPEYVLKDLTPEQREALKAYLKIES